MTPGIARGLRVVERASSGSEWQPIETAPQTLDEEVQLYCADTGEQFVGYRWSHKETGWVYAYTQGIRVVCHPTHWMPLPAPPGSDK